MDPLFKRKIPLLITSLLLIAGISLVSCDVNQVEEKQDEASLVDIQSRKAQLEDKFAKLGNALQAMNPEEVTPAMFKEATLTHFAGIDKSDKNYAEVKAKYEASYQKAKQGNVSIKRKSASSLRNGTNKVITQLITRVQRLRSYTQADRVFKNFYVRVQRSDAYSTAEKNKLLIKAINYQASLDFIARNHRMLGAAYDLSEYRSVKAREFSQQCDEQQYEEEDGEEQQPSDPQDPGDAEECNQDEGWWDSWGRCAAGTAGTAILSGGGGCATGAGLAAFPTLGLGAGPAYVGGAIVGTVGGALKGAADYCH